LLDVFGLASLSTGDILRDALKQGLLKADEEHAMLNGGLVGGETVLRLLRPQFEELRASGRGWVLDGYPRTPDQAKDLASLLDDVGGKLDMVLNIRVHADVIVERLKDRRVHLPSGRVYNLQYKPPRAPGLDDVTQEPLVQRNDDKPETIRRRLASFEEKTAPLIDHYEHVGILHHIDSPTSPEGWVHIERVIEDYCSQR
jgi:adenylate kinase family enzyme